MSAYEKIAAGLRDAIGWAKVRPEEAAVIRRSIKKQKLRKPPQ